VLYSIIFNEFGKFSHDFCSSIKDEFTMPWVASQSILFPCIGDCNSFFKSLSSFILNQPVAGSIIVTHHNFRIVLICYGPIRSTHILFQGVAAASFSGKCPYFLVDSLSSDKLDKCYKSCAQFFLGFTQISVIPWHCLLLQSRRQNKFTFYNKSLSEPCCPQKKISNDNLNWKQHCPKAVDVMSSQVIAKISAASVLESNDVLDSSSKQLRAFATIFV